MTIDFYTIITVLTEFLMLAMILHVFRYPGFSGTQKKWYTATFCTIMFCAAAEYAVHCGHYNVVYSNVLTIITVLQFSFAPMLGILFTGALGMHHSGRNARTFLALNLIAEVAAAPFGLIFYFDQNGYSRGDFFFIYEAFYLISLIYLIVNMVIVGKNFRNRDSSTIILVLTILAAGIVVTTLFRLNVAYLSIAMCACLCYIYYNDLVQQDNQEELQRNQQKITSMQERIITGMANLIENRDMETGEHITRTSAYVKMIAENASMDGVYSDELTDHFISLLVTLAPMHDIGKIVVSDAILRKPGKLTADEYEEMKKHADAGGRIVREVLSGIADEEYLSVAEDIVTYHHEKWDGSGYPSGLKGEEIPLSARIMAIADVYDALISERCYKKAIPPEDALRIIAEEAATHFDPELVRVFLKHKGDLARIS